MDFLPKAFTNFDIYPKLSEIPAINPTYTHNAKQTLIVYIQNKGNEEEMLVFLSKILKAVKYEIQEDVVLLGIPATATCPLNHLTTQFEVKKILNFGLTPKQLSTISTIPLYKKKIIGGFELLFADRLDVLMKNNVKKRQLWTCLQEMFL